MARENLSLLKDRPKISAAAIYTVKGNRFASYSRHGKGRERELNRSGAYYARADGFFITEAIYPMLTPNGFGITVVAPSGEVLRHVPLPDSFTTNICFGGPELRTAYATLLLTGKLVSFPWPVRGGLVLNFSNK